MILEKLQEMLRTSNSIAQASGGQSPEPHRFLLTDRLTNHRLFGEPTAICVRRVEDFGIRYECLTVVSWSAAGMRECRNLV